MNVSFHFAALRYLNQWLEKEKRIYDDLHSRDRETRRKAIVAGASHFRVARTLPRIKEAERHLGVLDVLDGIRLQDVEADPARTIVDTCKSISERYRNASVLSFTTKMLWLKFRSPIVILDSRALRALGIKRSDFEAYWKAWHVRYDQHQSSIIDACCWLPDVMPYIVDSTIPKKEVTLLSKSEWFQHRAFDIYLWHSGA